MCFLYAKMRTQSRPIPAPVFTDAKKEEFPMTETNEQSLLKPAETEKETVPESRNDPEKKPVTWEAAILLVLAFLASLWYWFGHIRLSGNTAYHGMGIGLTVSHWVLTAAALILAKVRNTLKLTPAGVFLLVLSMLLSAIYGIFANAVMKLLNLPVFLLLSAQALFILTGQSEFWPLSGQGLWEGFRRYFRSLFQCWAIPLRAITWRRHDKEEGNPNTEHIFFGISAAFGAAILALVILSSADEVFAGIMNNAIKELQKIDVIFIARMILAFLMAMLLFSHRASMLRDPVKLSPVTASPKNPTAVRMVLSALAVVYGLFAYIQIRYLFAGTESVQMSGGYAAYARSGFFQLVLVALLTLCLILPSLILCREDKPVRILSALVTVLTAVINFSAFFRMRLYIDAYGLTTLRIVTLWGIGIILLALLAALAKAFRPDLHICPVLAAIVLTTWIGLNFTNIDRIVAENQVARFNRDTQSETWISVNGNDSYWTKRISALASDQYWSPDYYPVFEKIENPNAKAQALNLLKTRGNAKRNEGPAYRTPRFYDWSLSYLKIPKE